VRPDRSLDSDFRQVPDIRVQRPAEVATRHRTASVPVSRRHRVAPANSSSSDYVSGMWTPRRCPAHTPSSAPTDRVVSGRRLRDGTLTDAAMPTDVIGRLDGRTMRASDLRWRRHCSCHQPLRAPATSGWRWRHDHVCGSWARYRTDDWTRLARKRPPRPSRTNTLPTAHRWKRWSISCIVSMAFCAFSAITVHFDLVPSTETTSRSSQVPGAPPQP